jgi:hypothetical protein
MDSHSQYYLCLYITDCCAGDTWRGDSRYTCYTTSSNLLLANLPCLLFPIYIIYRMWRYPYPFTMLDEATEEQIAQSFPHAF